MPPDVVCIVFLSAHLGKESAKNSKESIH